MKKIYILLFLFLLSTINSLEICTCQRHSASNVDDCRNCYNIGSFCCLLEYTRKDKTDVKYCTTLTQSDYDNIDSTITKRLAIVEAEELGTVYGFSIDCSSCFIKFPLLILILLLLWSNN